MATLKYKKRKGFKFFLDDFEMKKYFGTLTVYAKHDPSLTPVIRIFDEEFNELRVNGIPKLFYAISSASRYIKKNNLSGFKIGIA